MPTSHYEISGFLSVLSGLLAHLYYKTWEPSIHTYLSQLVACSVVSWSWHFYLGHSVPTATLLNTGFVLTHLVSLGTSIAIYRLFLHPLKGYPGPLAAKLTKWYGFYLTTFGKNHVVYPELHKKYGDVVRIGPNELSFSTPESVRFIHGAYSSKIAKGPNYDTRLWAGGISMGDDRDIQNHKQRRKFWDRGLNMKAIASYEPRLLKIISIFLQKLDKYEGQAIDVGNLVDCFAFDAMADLAFDESFHFLESERPSELADFVRYGLKMTEHFRNVTWLAPMYKYFPMPAGDKEKATEFAKAAEAQFEKRMALGKTPSDLFSYLLAQDESGHVLSRSDLASDSPVIIVAGSDTTAVCLSFVFYYITLNPPVMKKLLEEVDKAWEKHGDDLNASHLGHELMPYLNAVINESLRMVPPAPNGNQRTTPPGGFEVAGKYLPPGTQMYCHPTTMAHDARNFTDPEKYVPERWIDELRDPTWNHDVRAFIPFSAGQYICPGKALSYLEMRLFLTRSLRDHTFEMPRDFDHAGFWRKLDSYMGYIKPPIPLIVHKREKKHG